MLIPYQNVQISQYSLLIVKQCKKYFFMHEIFCNKLFQELTKQHNCFVFGYLTIEKVQKVRLKQTMVHPLCPPASEYDKLVYFCMINHPTFVWALIC